MTKRDLKIVFFGTPDFAVESLRRLVEGGYNVAAAVTMPDKRSGRGNHVQMSAVKQYALSVDIPVLQPEKLKDPEFVDSLRAIGADLFVVIAFRMLPEVVWAMPQKGTFNLHAALLPRYRGAAPINWAIINGETRTGVTTFFLQHEIDTGDIIDRVAIDILPSDDAGSIHDRLMLLGADLTIKTVDAIIDGSLTTTPQDQFPGEEPCPAPKIFKDTCHIDWHRPARQIHNLIRGLSPYPAAWGELYAGEQPQGPFKIFTSRITDVPASEPGRLTVEPGGHLFADCADVRLEILALQAPGKRRMDAREYLLGCRFDDMSLR